MSSSNEAYFRAQILLLTILWFTLENHIHVRPCTTWHMLKRFENKSEQTKCGQYATRPRKVNLLKEFLFETFFFQLWLQKSDNLQHNTLVCWFAGTNDWSSKCPMFQVCIIFFHNFLQNSLQDSFQFVFL